MFVVTTSASQTGRHALRPSAIEAHGACTKERSHSPRSFPSFVFFSFFPFLSPSFISCPPFCSPRQLFSSPFFFLFFFSLIRATVHGIIDRAMNTRTPLRFFRVTPSVTLPPSFVFNFLPRLPFTARVAVDILNLPPLSCVTYSHVRY